MGEIRACLKSEGKESLVRDASRECVIETSQTLKFEVKWILTGGEARRGMMQGKKWIKGICPLLLM